MAWHDDYDDPDSALSWRLRTAQHHLRAALDEREGAVRVISVCSGDGRDIIDVLRERDDADRVSATLLEVHPDLAAAARARAHGLSGVELRVLDAGHSDAYAGAVPADIVIMIGVFGNISDADIERTVRAAPQFCSPGATLLWSRSTGVDGHNDAVRAWFVDAGCTELAYDEIETAGGTAIGAMRFTGRPTELVPAQRLFTFLR